MSINFSGGLVKPLVYTFCFLAFTFFSCRDTISIEGSISNIPNPDMMCYLHAFDFARNRFVAIDSAKIDQDVFSFENLYWKNQLLRLSFGQEKAFNLFTEEEDIRIIGDYQHLDKVECLGTYAQEDARKFDKIKSLYQHKFDSLGILYARFSEISSFRMRDSIQRVYDRTLKRYHDKILDFAAQYHTTVFSPFVIYINLYDLDKERVVSIYKSYPTEVKKSYFGNKLYKSVLTVQQNRVGNLFPSFAGETLDGNHFHLDDVQSKLLIINFWSSHCEPCLEGMKVLRDLYNRFHNKGLEIVSITIDQKKEYIDNVSYYDLPWIHIHQKKNWESPLLKKYGVRYLPTNFILDGDRKILSKHIETSLVESFFSKN